MDLLQNLDGFVVLNQGDPTLFFQKLSDEYNWSDDFCKSAFEEYKRFIFLAVTAEERVVPSVVVDKIWHMHMTFTVSYWHDLCRDVLQQELHHVPSPKSKSFETEDRQAYQQTLLRYNRVFGTEPPSKVWPAPKRQTKKNSLPFKWLSLLFFSTFFITACSDINQKEAVYYFKWAVAIYVVYKILKWLDSGNHRGGGGNSGCSSSCGGGGD
ncbi:glycine-rich domain-containing protein [Litoribacillus peritrichatus]|uniref:glycine-rich domain-containing protein n=1 Tax=Litoribacillus peritrichatus TaxID=718191 RepID=UPI0031E3EA3E